jgi:hypothetical protein
MFYVKEDDMDDLLRRAAENYSVDADRAHDWESVRSAIEETAPAPAVVQPKRKRRFIFWWLLLIPAGWFASTEWTKFQASHKAAQQVQQPANITREKSSVPHENTKDDNAGSPAPNAPGESNKTKTEQKLSDENAYKVAGNRSGGHRLKSTGIVPAAPKPSAAIADQNEQDRTNISANAQPAQHENDAPNVVNDKDAGANNSVNTQQKVVSAGNASNDSKKETTAARATTSTSAKIKGGSGSNYFYAGLILGPDLSFVKFQQAQGVGINAGVIAGYKFKKLSVETGLIYAEKNYYTRGEYFDKSQIPYFNNAEITSIDGYCHMFEIPLNLRYNFGEKKNHAWFASAGFSSYLMHKEYYNFNYIRNDTAHAGAYPYYNASKNWFSILNLSAGYELKTGSKTSLRIEPYYKLPINGVGMGSISLSSVGINAGITRRIP